MVLFDVLNTHKSFNRRSLMQKIEKFLFTGEGDPLVLWDAIVFRILKINFG